MTLNETYQLINEYGKNFNSIWNNTLKSEFIKHEEFRKSELASFRSTEYLCVVLFIFCVTWLLFSLNGDRLFVPVLSIIAGLLLWQIWKLPQKADKNFTSQMKSLYMDTVMNAFAGIKRVPVTNIGEGDKWRLEKSDLFADFKFLDADDAFEGVHKGVKYGLAELNLSDYFHEDFKKQTKMSVFKGVVISFTANKTIKNKTMVSTRGDFKIQGLPICGIISCMLYFGYRIYLGEDILYWLSCCVIAMLILLSRTKAHKISQALALSNLKNMGFSQFENSKISLFDNTREIKLEDPRFMKRYKAFSSDEVEGRYLLTTAFMERLNNIRTAFGTENLKCSFVDDRFIVAISTKEDLFEICSLFTPMDNPKHLSKFYNQIVAVLLMSDYFKLEQKTGL